MTYTILLGAPGEFLTIDPGRNDQPVFETQEMCQRWIEDNCENDDYMDDFESAEHKFHIVQVVASYETRRRLVRVDD